MTNFTYFSTRQVLIGLIIESQLSQNSSHPLPQYLTTENPIFSLKHSKTSTMKHLLVTYQIFSHKTLITSLKLPHDNS
ncbi:hypothetical protein VIGAN_10140700 [Vigna angularis var. angularis]|uniref:Uncharacterized protein n=1 Tax=Vigna angularis var. angularis TaxID=157739 RepID=A0A0S3T4P6_PHAAN|nr:hypothetical protein VIGAN_10140700 [Vigna angularis var. angularis]